MWTVRSPSITPVSSTSSKVRIILLTLWLFAASTSKTYCQLNEHQPTPDDEYYLVRSDGALSYGVDVSWPIQHSQASCNFAWLPHNINPEEHPVPETYRGMPVQPLGDRQKIYEEAMQGCRDYYQERGYMCDATEESRIESNLRQPSQMTNYTELGFKKIRTPTALFQLIQDFWEANKHLATKEELGTGYSVINHWAVPTYKVDVYDRKLKGGGFELVNAIESLAAEIIQEWTGLESEPTFVYGIRTYHNGSILMPHVDDLPRVSSMIINVDQDVDEDWPLEVYGHDGKAYNVSMLPGEMVLYESHSVLHGRPFPLKGRFYANIFIHFAPGKNNKTAQQAARTGDLPSLIAALDSGSSIDERDENGWQLIHEAARGGFMNLVEYLIKNGEDLNSPTYYHGTPLDIALEEFGEDDPVIQHLRDLGALRSKTPQEENDGKNNKTAQQAARTGDLPSLIAALDSGSSIDERDENGWQLIHEAAQGGFMNLVEYLIKNGEDLNSPTYYHGTPLDIALEEFGEDHPVIQHLRDLGALRSTTPQEENDEL